jgi:nucleotide-binding universal stress UspA family protein
LSSSQLNVVEDRGTDVAEKILEIAEKEKIDAIVVRSRGTYLSSKQYRSNSPNIGLVIY